MIAEDVLQCALVLRVKPAMKVAISQTPTKRVRPGISDDAAKECCVGRSIYRSRSAESRTRDLSVEQKKVSIKGPHTSRRYRKRGGCTHRGDGKTYRIPPGKNCACYKQRKADKTPGEAPIGIGRRPTTTQPGDGPRREEEAEMQISRVSQGQC